MDETISEISTSNQTPKDMVFSQTSHKTQSTLKVVELDRLKPEKTRQVNGLVGVTDGMSAMPPSSVATSSSYEVRSPASHEYLKQEPIFESTMFHETDYEFFQDLVPLCSGLGKEEQAQITDSSQKIEESVHNTDTLLTPYPALGWEAFDANSPTQSGFYLSTPTDSLSPTIDGFAPLDTKFLYTGDEKKVVQELDFDIASLPVVVEQLASEQTVDLNSAYIVSPVDYTPYTVHTPTDTSKMLYFDFDDMKMDVVQPTEVDNNLLTTQYTTTHNTNNNWEDLSMEKPKADRKDLSLNVHMATPRGSFDINTPDVLQTVEQLERQEHHTVQKSPSALPYPQDSSFLSTDNSTNISLTTTDYDAISPKPETSLDSDLEAEYSKSLAGRRRKHRVSEESDETYTPYFENTSPKRKKRNIPIKQLITALEEAVPQPKRRGRPPKRRDSVLSTYSIDDNASSLSVQDKKYREGRDKNNEASKRSRMNRKLKELQMEQLAIDLEERNKKLKVKADILEDMTKRLKDALMTAILQK